MIKNKSKTIFILNFVFLLAILISDIFYIIYGGILLKGFTSGLFVILGLINLIYNIIKKNNIKFSILLFCGLFFAMLGDIVLNINFIFGAILFAVGHILFFASYTVLKRFRVKDLLFGLIIFIPSLLIITLVPIFNYGGVLMEIVCCVYALIISLMLGKAISNFVAEKNLLNSLILVGSILFYFSDFMLLFDVFSSLSAVFRVLCLATYYPAEFLLAHSLFSAKEKNNDKE